MIDEQVKKHIKSIIEANAEVMADRINTALMHVTSDMQRRGLIHSSMHVVGLKRACNSELELRATFIWETFRRVLETTRQQWYEGIADDLKSEFEPYLNIAIGEMHRLLQARIPPGLQNPATLVTVDGTPVSRRFSAEIDLYCTGMRASEVNSETGSQQQIQNQYNFSGAVNSVQTGNNAIANIVVNEDSKRELDGVLNQILAALKTNASMSESDKRDAIEIATESINEIRKQEPNKRRLMSALHDLGDVTGLLANASTLYPILRNAAAAIGVYLP